MPLVVPSAPVAKGGPSIRRAPPDDRLTIHPSPFVFMPGIAACARSMGACTFTSNMMCRRRNGNSTIGLWIPAAARQVVMVVDGAGRQHDVGPLGGQAFGDRRPDAPAGAGDDGLPAPEPRSGDAHHRYCIGTPSEGEGT